MRRMNRRTALSIGMAPFCSGATGFRVGSTTPSDLSEIYRARMDRFLVVPQDDLLLYQGLVEAKLSGARADVLVGQYLLAVDRSPWVQAAILFWRSGHGEYRLVGASPVSTGRPGSFDHFETPEGVFDHTPTNPDFRARGTRNSHGIRGYGTVGLRVYDFGWQKVPKGWGNRAIAEMRLQMHATDPDLLENLLGSAQSKGCIRIPATLNELLDHYGLLDAEYERLAKSGKKIAVLKTDRETVAEPGRYLVVVDSRRAERPAWSPAPVHNGSTGAR